ncbi:MAG: hypothetical protein WA642_07510 [Steroidobacteraceae bacterium]
MRAAIQTASGNYLTAVNAGGLGGPDTGPAAVALHTDATAAGPWETFRIVWLNSTYTQFALQTSGGNYVTAVNGGGVGGPNDSTSPMHTDAKSIAEWEMLTLNFLPNNQVTISVPDGRFLTAVNGGGISGPTISPIRTDAVRHGAWEAFTLVKLDTDSGDAVLPAPTPKPKSVELPATDGAWLVNVTISGGLAGRHIGYAINSQGHGATSNARGNTELLISRDLLATVAAQVRIAQAEAWVDGSDSCDDCVYTSITLAQRKKGGGVLKHSVTWTALGPGGPSNASALVDAVLSALPHVDPSR